MMIIIFIKHIQFLVIFSFIYLIITFIIYLFYNDTISYQNNLIGNYLDNIFKISNKIYKRDKYKQQQQLLYFSINKKQEKEISFLIVKKIRKLKKIK